MSIKLETNHIPTKSPEAIKNDHFASEIGRIFGLTVFVGGIVLLGVSHVIPDGFFAATVAAGVTLSIGGFAAFCFFEWLAKSNRDIQHVREDKNHPNLHEYLPHSEL